MSNDWWVKDVPKVLAETGIFYTRVEEKYPDKNRLEILKKKIVTERDWAPTLRLYESRFDSVLKQLGFVYVPNRILPGPAFVFPIRDVDGKFTCAQTKPLDGSVLYAEKSKYHYIGEKPIGPRWLGNDPATLKQIIDTQTVGVVEGGFDILAARLMCPDCPILSPLTKVLGKNHIAYLRMLGVKHLVLIYDNEMSKKEGKLGAGNMSMEYQAKSIKSMKVGSVELPHPDPSECLKSMSTAERMKSRIEEGFRVIQLPCKIQY